MTDLFVLGTWVLAGLVLAAVISALITRHQRRREVRRHEAAQLVDALARYAAWVASQRRNAAFSLNDEVAESALREASLVQAQAFPRLALEWASLLEVHRRLVAFLAHQQRLRLADPEAWLDSDHDARFLDLWRQHQHALHVITRRLERVVDGASVDRPRPGSA